MNQPDRIRPRASFKQTSLFDGMESSYCSSASFDDAPYPALLKPSHKMKASPRAVNDELWVSMVEQQIHKQKQHTPSASSRLVPNCGGRVTVLGLDPNLNQSLVSAPSLSRGVSVKNTRIVSDLFLAEAKDLHRQQSLITSAVSKPVSSKAQKQARLDAELLNAGREEGLKHFPRMDASKATRNSIPRSDNRLSYALRRTDSTTTFQSLDGLNSAYPLIRKDHKRRKDAKRNSSQQKDHRRRRSRRSATRHQLNSTASIVQTLNCMVTPCFGIDNRVLPAKVVHLPSSSTKSRSPEPPPAIPLHLSRTTKVDPLATRDALIQLRSELTELRRIASQSVLTESSSVRSGSTGRVTTATTAEDEASSVRSLPPPRRKNVHFAAPIVTLVKYRPYTEEAEIPLLYFQEEELDELEFDREMVLGDQFECSMIVAANNKEAGLSVRIAHCVAADE